MTAARTVRRRPIAIALLLLVAAVAAAAVIERSADDDDDGGAVCAAVAAGRMEDAARALPATYAPDASDDALRALACGCRALIALHRAPACVERLEHVVVDVDAPLRIDARLATLLAHTWAQRGDRARAARLITSAAAKAPGDADVLAEELEIRAPVDGDAAFDDAERRLGDLDARTLVVAEAELRAGRAERARALLARAQEPQAAPAALRADWHYARMRAAGALRDTAGVKAIAALAVASGEPAALAHAQEAAALLTAEIADDDVPALVDEAIAHEHEIADRDLVRFLAFRWVQLVPAGPARAARAQRVHAIFPDAAPVDDGAAHDDDRLGTVELHADGGVVAVVREDRPELDPERVVVTNGVARVTRPANAPVRWAWRAHDDSASVASGVAWPEAGAVVSVAITPAPPRAAAPRDAGEAADGAPAPHARAAGDGRRRVVAVLLDSGDWRVVQALRARGELPALGALLADGVRATVHSAPATTSAALHALVFPSGATNTASRIADLGTQVATVGGVDENPLAGFLWLAPPQRTLFAVLGQERAAANLLFGAGGLAAGRSGDVVGPRGALRRLPPPGSRALRDDEKRGLSAIDKAPAEARVTVDDAAALFDLLARLAAPDGPDVVIARVDATDTAAHLTFQELLQSGQDDGDRFLYDLYRYCDARIGALRAALDDDDVLVVFSDHGTRTAFDHDERALFVAAGGGLPAGAVVEGADVHELAAAFAALAGVDAPPAWPRGPLARALARPGAKP